MEAFEELMVSEEDIEYATRHPFGPEEHAFAQAGMNIATDVRIFSEGPIYTSADIHRKKISRIADVEDVEKYQFWKTVIDKVGKHDNEGSIINYSVELMPIGNPTDMVVEPKVICRDTVVEEDPTYLRELNEEQ